MKVNSIVLNNIYSKKYNTTHAISFKNNDEIQTDQYVSSTIGQDVQFEKKVPENFIESKTIKSFAQTFIDGLKKFFRIKTDLEGTLTDDGLSDLIMAHVYAL